MPAPSVFTVAFHRDFFLPLLVRSFGAKEPRGHAGFEQHVPVEFPVLAVLDILLVPI